MKEIKIRMARVSDAETLLQIYAPYILSTAITFEYAVPTVEEFAWRIGHVLEKFPYLVAESAGEILGYAYASPFKGRRAYDWSIETSIYVKMDARGMGVGRQLHDALEDMLRRQNICNMCACIAYPTVEDDPYLSDGSVCFHEKLGYRMVGKFNRCAYKFSRWYDMVWMEKWIGEHREKQPEVVPVGEIEKR